MKKTLNEEKERILNLIEQGVGDFGASQQRTMYHEQNQQWMKKLYNLILDMYTEIREREGYKFAEADAELKTIIQKVMYRWEHGAPDKNDFVK